GRFGGRRRDGSGSLRRFRWLRSLLVGGGLGWTVRDAVAVLHAGNLAGVVRRDPFVGRVRVRSPGLLAVAHVTTVPGDMGRFSHDIHAPHGVVTGISGLTCAYWSAPGSH